MKPLLIHDICTAVGGTLLCGNGETSVSAVCTDTRSLLPDSLFVPLSGERFDAHNFIPQALDGGCLATLTARRDVRSDKAVIYVPDTRRALGQLAAYYRRLFTLPVLAVTGSVGKTTVKELTAAVLGTQLCVLKTEGNFNNEIGLPLTLLRLEERHQAAVTEMGMSGFGEIDALASAAAPDIAIMTNIGLSHIEHLGSQENIYKAKAELLAHIRPNGKVILNLDDPILRAKHGEISLPCLTVGTTSDCDVFADEICAGADSVSFVLHHGRQQVPVRLSFPGEHNVINALLACAAGLCLSISLEAAAAALAAYVPIDGRMQLMDLDGITVINDCYNAAPASMEAALKVLCARSGRKIAVLGDIKELGEHTASAHNAIGRFAATLPLDALLTLGDSARLIARGAVEGGMAPDKIASFDDIDALNQALGAETRRGDNVLVKASRVMRLERVTEYLAAGGRE